jgi:hypothetical protein
MTDNGIAGATTGWSKLWATTGWSKLGAIIGGAGGTTMCGAGSINCI